MRTARALTVSPNMLCAGRGACWEVHGPRRGSAWSRGCMVWGAWSQGGIPACTEADPPPVNRMTNRCRNITLPQTSFAGGKNAHEENSMRGTVQLHLIEWSNWSIISFYQVLHRSIHLICRHAVMYEGFSVYYQKHVRVLVSACIHTNTPTCQPSTYKLTFNLYHFT